MKIIFRILLIFSLFNSLSSFGQCSISVLDSGNITCYGGNDGFIQVSGNGGLGIFHYSLQIYNSTFNYWQQIGQSPLGNNFTYADVTFSSLTAQCYQIVLEDPNGCSDTANVCLTEPQEILFSTSITSCDSLFWGGSNYYISGQYVNVFSSQLGCDSTVTLDLTINSSDTNSFSVNTCNYYTWDGVIYNTSGQYNNVYTNQNGCDSIVTLDLTISNSIFTSISDTACDNYTWDGVVYTNSGQYTNIYTTQLACDSTVTLDLIINNSDTSITTVASCDFYIWNGISYFVSGVYDSLFTNANGCDSLVTLDLTINISDSSSISVISCDTFIWDGAFYNSTGLYTNVYSSLNGCDSIVTLDLTINISDSSSISVTSCDTYDWDGTTYDSTGIYNHLYTNINGCDSLLILNLLINYSSESYTYDTACGLYIWNGGICGSSGFYGSQLTGSNGCDSIAYLHLILYDDYSFIDTVTSCNSYYWDGISYDSSGLYTNVYNSLNGCDSTVTLDLTINNSIQTLISDSACDTYIWDGVIYTASGQYSNVYTNQLGCDSTVTLNLTIYNSILTSISDTACDTFTWDGVIYDTTGQYTNIYTSQLGCDSTVTLDLTINILGCMDPLALNYNPLALCSDVCQYPACNVSVLDSQNITCFGGNDGFIEVEGTGGIGLYHYSIQVYNSTFGIWQQIGQSPLGNGYTFAPVTFTTLFADCYKIVMNDSLGCLDTIDVCLTEPQEILFTNTITTCNTHTWDGVVYDSTGIYTNIYTTPLGCDSTVTLNLTINNSILTSISDTACNTYIWDGIVYTASGQYINIYASEFGCDSTVTLDLTINNSITTVDSLTICDGDSVAVGGNIYILSGYYTDTLQTVNGCDSIINTVIYVMDVNITQNDTTICFGDSISLTAIFFEGNLFDTIITPNSSYEYSSTSYLNWQNNLGGWSVGNAPFGNVSNGYSGVTEFNYQTYWSANTDLYLRKAIDLTYYDLSSIEWFIGVDNGYTLYINGVQVSSANAGGFTYRWEYSGLLDSINLIQGINIIAILAEDMGGLSAFDMMLTGNPLLFNNILWSNGDTTENITVNPSQTTNYWVTQTINGVSCSDSVIITVNQPTYSTTTTTSCGSLVWNGTTYTTSGIYDSLFTNFVGCDSLVTLDLTIINSDTTSSIVTSCDTYIWNGVVYNSSGQYTNIFSSIYGCDSIVILDLSIISSISNFVADTACDTYTWDGVVYNSSGQYTNIYNSLNGCDSIVTLNLIINNSISTTLFTSACDTYIWDGVSYSISGQYINVYNSINGCDSTVILNLTIDFSQSNSISQTSCDTYIWNGIVYDSTGQYTNIYTSQAGCDSMVTLDLVINNSISISFSDTACDNYIWDSQVYTSSGQYVNIYASQSGCDSIVTLNLIINYSYSFSSNASACDSYLWEGQSYTVSGQYINIYSSISGCDSTVTLILTINNSITNLVSDTACNSYSWDGVPYTSSGQYTNLYNSQSGCDSTVILDLIINNSITTLVLDTACVSYSWDGITYDSTGQYINIYSSFSGCDSTVTLDLIIFNNISTSVSDTSCDSYLWDGIVYNTTGLYTNVYTSQLGCDSTVILNLSINDSISISIYDTLCDSYLWAGIVYDSTGTYSNIFSTINGCDSIVNLNLIIKNSVLTFLADTSCDNYIWDGQVYSSSGQYINTYLSANGCDSIVTLDLTINNSNSSSSYLTTCDSYLWNGTTYFTSGLYDTLLVNSNGCDSLAQIFLTIIQPNIINLIVESCGSYLYNGATYDSSGIYIDSLLNSYGCDSVITLDLTVSLNLTISASVNNVDCYGDLSGEIDVEVLSGIPPYTYSWSNGLITQDLSQLAGNSLYLCSIVDSVGCDLDISFFINQPQEVIVTTSTINSSCNGINDGSVSMNVLGGVYPYIISWNGVDTNNLYAGVFEYQVLDSLGCLLIDSIEIFEPDQISINYNLLNIQCFGDFSGFIDVTVLSGSGTSPYSYNWSGPNQFSATTSFIFNLEAGNYNLTITDDNLCVFDTVFFLSEPIQLNQVVDVYKSDYSNFNISCFGGNNAWIYVDIYDGYGPYQLSWSNGLNNDSIYNLVAGNYSLVITDNLGCTFDFDFDLIQPSQALSGNISSLNDFNGYDISCYNYNDGEIDINVVGGVAPYNYLWGNGIAVNMLQNLYAGSYSIDVYDNNNCLLEDSIVLVQPDSLIAFSIAKTDTCSKNVGSVQIITQAGVSPYLYTLDNQLVQSLIENLDSNLYTVKITDNNQCEIFASFLIDNLSSPDTDFNIYNEDERLYDQINNPILFESTSDGLWQSILSWEWDFGDNSYANDSLTYHSYSDIGVYEVTLTVYSQYNCITYLTKTVTIQDYDLFIPNAFTPSEQDDLNNIFKPKGYGVEIYELKIYDRWGGIVFISEDLDIGWDGLTSNGTPYPVGVYGYSIYVENVFNEEHKYEGVLKLLR